MASSVFALDDFEHSVDIDPAGTGLLINCEIASVRQGLGPLRLVRNVVPATPPSAGLVQPAVKHSPSLLGGQASRRARGGGHWSERATARHLTRNRSSKW